MLAAMNRHARTRADLESLIFADVRALSAVSEQIGQVFAGLHTLSRNDFRALLHIMVADSAGTPLTAGELRQKMGLSGAAITYLVERMIESGHVRRDTDADDRRKVMLRYADDGLAVARAFFAPLADHGSAALTGLPEADLTAAHRVFTALIGAMHAFQAELTGQPGPDRP